MSKSLRAGWFARCRVGLLGLALGAGLACSNAEGEARDNLDKWREKGPASYTYVVETLCFCPDVEPTRVVVRDGAVTDTLGMETGLPRPDYANTMTEVLEEGLRIAKQDPEKFDAKYDDELGYLKELSVDYSGGSADDEFFTVVSCFSTSTEDTACPAPTLSSCDGESRNIDAEQPRATCGEGQRPTGRIEGTLRVCCPTP
jgi:uncharacterized protein DUF6174